MHRNLVGCGLLAGALLAAGGCGGEEKTTEWKTMEECIEQQPSRIPGLEVDGSRSVDNVANQIWKIDCRLQLTYRNELRKKTELAGDIRLRFPVDYNGEIGTIEVLRSSIEDEDFVRKIRYVIDTSEFPFWADRESDETVVTVTFEFGDS